jgi:hypothetical protein
MSVAKPNNDARAVRNFGRWIWSARRLSEGTLMGYRPRGDRVGSLILTQETPF